MAATIKQTTLVASELKQLLDTAANNGGDDGLPMQFICVMLVDIFLKKLNTFHFEETEKPGKGDGGWRGGQ